MYNSGIPALFFHSDVTGSKRLVAINRNCTVIIASKTLYLQVIIMYCDQQASKFGS